MSSPLNLTFSQFFLLDKFLQIEKIIFIQCHINKILSLKSFFFHPEHTICFTIDQCHN